MRLGWIHVCGTEHPVGLEGQDHQMAWAAVRVPSLWRNSEVGMGSLLISRLKIRAVFWMVFLLL